MERLFLSNLTWNQIDLSDDWFLTVNPSIKLIQPAIKNTPPIGVIIPMPLSPTVLAAFKNISAYNEPENSNIPMIKLYPANFIHLFRNLSNSIPVISNAKL